MSVGGAGARLIELREPQRGAQAEAARAPLSPDGNGGEICILGGRGILGIRFQEDVAANAMEERVSASVLPSRPAALALR